MSDEIDLESLDVDLSSDDSPDNFMMSSDLDGFLHGVIYYIFPIPKGKMAESCLGERATKLRVSGFIEGQSYARMRLEELPLYWCPCCL